MIDRWHRLGIWCAPKPCLPHPVRPESVIDSFKSRQEAGQQLILSEREVFMLRRQIIAAIDDVITSKVFRGKIVGMFNQR